MAVWRGYCTVWTKSHTQPFVKPWVGKTQQSLVLPNPPEPDNHLQLLGLPLPSPRKTPQAKVEIRLRLGRQHPRSDREVDRYEETEGKRDSTLDDNNEETPTYRILWTATALLRMSHIIRHRMTAEVQAQKAGIREAVARGRAGSVEKECA